MSRAQRRFAKPTTGAGERANHGLFGIQLQFAFNAVRRVVVMRRVIRAGATSAEALWPGMQPKHFEAASKHKRGLRRRLPRFMTVVRNGSNSGPARVAGPIVRWGCDRSCECVRKWDGDRIEIARPGGRAATGS